MTEPADVHEDRDASSRAVRDARLAWILGGSLLIAHAVLTLVASGAMWLSFPGAGYVFDVLWAAALVIFAFGIRGSGSVVGKRPGGVAALLVAAVMPFALTAVLAWLSPSTIDDTYDPTLNTTIVESLLGLGLAALVIACIVIAQAGAVPRRWRWMPLVLVAVGAAPQLIATIAMVSIRDPWSQAGVAMAMQTFGHLSTLATLALGILAIVLAPRDAPRTTDPVQVYPPAS
jgi:hypothetical protein